MTALTTEAGEGQMLCFCLLARCRRTAIFVASLRFEERPVSISVYDQSIARTRHMLQNLDNIVSKAEAYSQENDIEPSALLRARLFPSMGDFIFQVQVATDMAKSGAARLSDTEVPKWSDDEETFADVHARIKKSLDFLATFRPEQFEGCETRELELKLGSHSVNFTGQSYLLGFVLPNFYFHMTTAYNLLRHNGLDLGKRDFLGDI
jgi:hypothetical protein